MKPATVGALCAAFLLAALPVAISARGDSGAARVELGRRLFYDGDLSADGSMACASCHEQKHGFAHPSETRPGVTGEAGRRNVPGLANLAGLRHFNWADNRIATLEAQAEVPMFGDHPVELGMKGREAELARRIAADPCYVAMFRRAFPERRGRIETATITGALAAFTQSLVSRHSLWERGVYPLSPAARRGARHFAGACASCHAGSDFTDGDYHALERSGPDIGLMEATGNPADSHRFRTPGLRNVAVTGPWMHDGRAATLGEALDRHGAAARLSPAERADMLAFLATLTDDFFLQDKRFGYPETACGRKP